MKIDELVEKLNELKSLRAEKKSDGILIYSKQSTGYDFFFSLAYKNESLADVGFDWDCLKNVGPADLHKALNLVDCFIHTPIKERFPEKKYRLVAKRKIDQMPKYVKKIITGFDEFIIDFTNLKSEAMQYNESDLKAFAEREPSLTLAIDAMKEPVEDD